MNAADAASGVYGPYGATTQGVLSEHLYRSGATVRRTAPGVTVAVFADGSSARVVCSELIEIYTEDGRSTGRCGGLVDAGGFACPGHAEEIAGWRSQTEAQTIAWERNLEGAR